MLKSKRVFTSLATAVLLTVTGWYFLNCGRKGPPIVPRLVVPQAPGKFKVDMECNRIHLSFVPPQKNNDGTPFTDLYGIQIYRQRKKAEIPPLFTAQAEEMLSSQEEQTSTEDIESLIEEVTGVGGEESSAVQPTPTPETEDDAFSSMRQTRKSFQASVDSKYKKLDWIPVDKKFKEATEISLEELALIEGAGIIDPPQDADERPTIHLFDEGEGLKHGFEHEEGYIYSYYYQIRLINEHDDYSSFSKKEEVYFALIPAPPTDIRWEPIKSGIRLYWDPPVTMCDGSPLKHTVYFNIYKREEKKRFSDNPINDVPIKEYNYLIKNLNQDKPFFFQIRTVQINPYRQSLPCPEFEVVIKDTEPPSPPQKLIAIGGFNLVSLLWDAPRDRDVQGYNIYRTLSLDQEWEKINAELVEGTTYVDRTVDLKAEYYYAVSAVDDSPQENESEHSNVQHVVFH